MSAVTEVREWERRVLHHLIHDGLIPVDRHPDIVPDTIKAITSAMIAARRPEPPAPTAWERLDLDDGLEVLNRLTLDGLRAQVRTTWWRRLLARIGRNR